ncbi:MAG TPA: hypothetical protein VMH87_02865 [Pseudomonadales bacterium]|nr:hypothetical protein [Pseudomonadales bacterium]
MAFLKDCPNGHGELLFALGTEPQPGPDFGVWIVGNPGEFAVVIALAMGTDNAVFPDNLFEVLTRLFLSAETVKQLNQSQVFLLLFRFHATTIRLRSLFVN